MDFKTSTSLENTDSNLLIIRVFKNRPPGSSVKIPKEGIKKIIHQVMLSGDFEGSLGETLLLVVELPKNINKILLVGLGDRGKYTREAARLALFAATKLLKKLKNIKAALAPIDTRPKQTTLQDEAVLVREVVELSLYEFNEYKKDDHANNKKGLGSLILIGKNKTEARLLNKGLAVGAAICAGVITSRDLGNRPGNVATPKYLAKRAEEIVKQHPNLKITVLDERGIKKERMHALLAVSQGSDQGARFIILEHRTKIKSPLVVLVGKGITFDSGGISIKPSEKMEDMKFDMAGAATVLGVIESAARLHLPINLIGIVAASENLLSGKSLKPGDIINTRAGKTVEVINTDAEGRLVLADALDFAKQFKPDLVIDYATLTGAIVVALGNDLIGGFSNNIKLLNKIQNAGYATGENIWPMPLHAEYYNLLKSDYADLRNVGTSRYADSINAALFLQKFTNYPWIHLDIAGTAWAVREKPCCAKGATGAGVRLTIEFLKNFKLK